MITESFSFYPFSFRQSSLSLILARDFLSKTAHHSVLGQLNYSSGFERIRIDNPSNFLLKEIGHERYSLIGAIMLNIQYSEDNLVVASDPILHIYGVGETIDEAVVDYVSMLIDFYEELQASRDVLSTHLSNQFDYVQSIIVAN